MKIYKHITKALPKIGLILLLSMLWAAPTFAHRSPEGCTGSGLGINLFVSATEVHVGDTISYDVKVFNGIGVGPIVCDASNITASLVTPDGITHPITLTRTTLTNAQSDYYPDIVKYIARTQDVKQPDGIMRATASDTGTIHQNDSNSVGSVFQAVNTTVLLTPVPALPATLHVIKLMVIGHGGTAVASDFMVHVKSATSSLDVSGSPAAGAATPGTSYSLSAGTYAISENANASYVQSFGPDCPGGSVTLVAGDSKICTVINTDIPAPVIPPVIISGGGGGSYTPVVPPIVAALPPPIINIVKVPSRLTPFPFGGGFVTYTYTVTNPGVVAMHDVAVTDDKCAPVSLVSVDKNGNNLLDPGESWIYTCQMNIPVSTRNIATAIGKANGFTVLGYAFANVLVSAAPHLPNTGFPPLNKGSVPWNIIIPTVIFAALFSLYLVQKKLTA